MPRAEASKGLTPAQVLREGRKEAGLSRQQPCRCCLSVCSSQTPPLPGARVQKVLSRAEGAPRPQSETRPPFPSYHGQTHGLPSQREPGQKAVTLYSGLLRNALGLGKGPVLLRVSSSRPISELGRGLNSTLMKWQSGPEGKKWLTFFPRHKKAGCKQRDEAQLEKCKRGRLGNSPATTACRRRGGPAHPG